MSLRTIILTLTFIAAAVPAFGQYRPIPDQTQHYSQRHSWGPGISTPSNQFVHAPVLNDPMCCECQECKTRPIQYLADEYHSRYSPAVWGPTLLCKLRRIIGVNRIGVGFYGGAEYIRWSTNSPSVQPLVTTSVAGTIDDDAGVLGRAGTSTLFGGELYEDSRNGGRYTGAIVLDAGQRLIIEAIYTEIGRDELAYRADSGTAGIVARPFFNSTISDDDSRLVVFPGLVDGRVDITGSTEFDTFQIALRRSLGSVFGLNADYTIGYRKADLSDDLQVLDITNSLAGGIAGTRFETRDQFRTENEFHGIDFGLVTRMRPNNRLSIDFLAKVALGRTDQEVRIDGRTITRPPGGVRTGVDGGLLTQPTNIGDYSGSDFSAIFEFGTTLRYQFHPQVQGSLGYTFLAWSDVARVANQLDDSVNTSQFGGGALVGDPRPLFNMDTSQFTAHGLRIGLQISF